MNSTTTLEADSAAAPTAKVRKRRVQQRSVETREKIIRAAGQEFAANGYDGAATRAIAAVAGVQHTLVTYHFGGKEGLWQATLRYYAHDRLGRIQRRLDGLRGVEMATKVYLFLDDFVRYSAEYPEFAWMMGNVAYKPNPQLDWLYEVQLKPGFERIEEMIRGAQESGHFIEGEPRHLYYMFIGMATRIFMLAAEVEMVLCRSPFDAEFVDVHARTCLNAFFRKLPNIDTAALQEWARSSKDEPAYDAAESG